MKKSEYFELGSKIMNVIFMLFSLLVFATPCFYEEQRIVENGEGVVKLVDLRGYELFSKNAYTCGFSTLFIVTIIGGLFFFIYEIFSHKRILYVELGIYTSAILAFIFMVSRLSISGYIYLAFEILFFISTYVVKFNKKFNEKICFYLLLIFLVVLLPSGMALSMLYLSY